MTAEEMVAASASAPGFDRAPERSFPAEIARALRRIGLLDAAPPRAAAPLAGGVSSDIWRVDLPSGAGLRQAGAGQAARSPPTGRRRSSATATRSRWMRDGGRIVPEAVPRMLAPRSGGRPLRHGLSATRATTGCGRRAARRARRRRGRGRGRRGAWRASMPAPPAGAEVAARFDDRRDLPRHPPRALSRGDRASAIPTCADGAPGAGRSHGRDQARPGAWRRQPEEHPGRPARARCCSTPNAPGTATRRSTSPSASTTCC